MLSARLRVSAVYRGGSFERVIMALHRKRAVLSTLTAVSYSGVWTIDIEASVPESRLEHVIQALAREPVVLDVRRVG